MTGFCNGIVDMIRDADREEACSSVPEVVPTRGRRGQDSYPSWTLHGLGSCRERLQLECSASL